MTANDYINRKLGDILYTQNEYNISRYELEQWLNEFAEINKEK